MHPYFFPHRFSAGAESTMQAVTLRVLEGADRGRVYESVSPPISIGREAGNTIQLNDDRVSRFHMKLQYDHENVVLTDLESTNGTRVNGEDTQLRILRYGDMISVGRSTLLFGTREQISERMQKLNRPELDKKLNGADAGKSNGNPDLPWQVDPNYQLGLLEGQPPVLPKGLSPGQAAQLAELIEYLHMNLRKLLAEVEFENRGESVRVGFVHWQKILDLQSRLAEYLKQVGRS
jgi:pSer/pThr/pTyr-binding forkhead associated (FHA) protein